ncbi:MAG TPA: ankyrin repeat domain-containing protein [Gammaproteobacteria bacterium]|nr:ankyrin repeat domain-containing protein [Gammaproteobacteria bacterium]
MDDVAIESQRIANLTRIIARALEACEKPGTEADRELEMLLIGPHARTVALGILEFRSAALSAIKRGARLWLPFGGREHLLYELVSDRSYLGIQRVKNLLEAGWDPNLALPGSNRTALMQVANNWTPGNKEMAELLLAAGADASLASVSGQTALDYAPTIMRNFIKGYVKGDDTTTAPGVLCKSR